MYSISKIYSHNSHFYNFKTKKFDLELYKHQLTEDFYTDNFREAVIALERLHLIEQEKPYGQAHYPCLRDNLKIINVRDQELNIFLEIAKKRVEESSFDLALAEKEGHFNLEAYKLTYKHMTEALEEIKELIELRFTLRSEYFSNRIDLRERYTELDSLINSRYK